MRDRRETSEQVRGRWPGGGAQRAREWFEYQISSEYKRGKSKNKRAIG